MQEIVRLKSLNNNLLKIINESMQFDLSLKLGNRNSCLSLQYEQPRALRDYLINVIQELEQPPQNAQPEKRNSSQCSESINQNSSF